MKQSRQFQGASIRHLVFGAFAMLRARITHVSVTCLFFGLLLAATSTFVNAQVDAIQTEIANKIGITNDALMERVTEWATKTTDMDLLRLAVNSNATSFAAVPTIENAPMLAVLRTGPYVLGLLLFDLIILALGFTFFLTLFSDPLLSPFDIAKRLPYTTVRLCGLLIWIFFRSFAWIPIAGPIVSMYFLPRFILSPVLVSSGDSGIRESVHVSMARTSGQWLSVVGRLLILIVLTLALLWFVLVVASVLSLFVLKIGFLVWLIGLFAVVAFQAAYIVVLTAVLV